MLTGETGAGKTMVTVGLLLALGSVDRRRWSATARAPRMQARFDATVDAEEWAEDGEVILARSIARDGRSTARIGGQLATASALATLGSGLPSTTARARASGCSRRPPRPRSSTAFAGDAPRRARVLP